MSTLFMIGNGFDLNCGMKTRYKDIYEGYIMTVCHSKVVSQFKDDISDNIETWSDFELAMSEYASRLNSEIEFTDCINDFLEYLNKYLSSEEHSFLSVINSAANKDGIIREMKQSLESFYDGITNNISYLMEERQAGRLNNIQAISFNYTSVLMI